MTSIRMYLSNIAVQITPLFKPTEDTYALEIYTIYNPIAY